jgi:Polyketide cyclase / dehydrase and lipid transport
MALITQTQVIDAPIDRVFDTMIDAGNYAAWNPTITASRRLDEGELRDGSRFEWQLKGFGTVIQEFREFERNARIRIVLQTKRYSGGHQGLNLAQDGQCSIKPPLPILYVRKNLRQNVTACNTRCNRGCGSGKKGMRDEFNAGR